MNRFYIKELNWIVWESNWKIDTFVTIDCIITHLSNWYIWIEFLYSYIYFIFYLIFTWSFFLFFITSSITFSPFISSLYSFHPYNLKMKHAICLFSSWKCNHTNSSEQNAEITNLEFWRFVPRTWSFSYMDSLYQI